MAGGCRDCETCTKPGLARLVQDWSAGLLHFGTAGMSLMIKRGVARHCPQCKHLLSAHARRTDGSFLD